MPERRVRQGPGAGRSCAHGDSEISLELPGAVKRQDKDCDGHLGRREVLRGVPGVLVKFVQSKALAESVTNFQKAVRQLDLGPHPDFVTWKMKATGRGSSKSSAAREGKQPLKQSTQRSDPYGLIEAVEATCSFFGYLCLIWFVGAVSRLAIRFAAWHSVLASSRRRILDTSLIVEHLRVLFF